MKTTAHKRKSLSILIAIAAMLAYCSMAFSAEDTNDSAGTEAPSGRQIEQITVIAERSFFRLRAQLKFAQEKMYSTYNDFNEDDDKDVNCKQTDFTDTHIQEQQCWPVFFEKLVAENSQAAMRGEDILLTVPQLENRHRELFDELRANMIKVANESPEVAASLAEFGLLEQTYRESREECMKKPAFLLILRRCP